MIFCNRMKKKLRQGECVFGPMVSEIRSPGIAVLFAGAGFDFFFIDMEHSCFSLETVSDMTLAARAAQICTIVRPPSRNASEHLSRPLDSGADGLLIPQVQTREDVEKIVSWTRYQPLGERGMGLSRMHTFFKSGNAVETMKQLNDEILIALQIEHITAVENLDDILSVPGIDAAFVGPADLSASMGKPGQPKDPEVIDAIHRVLRVSAAHNVIPGIHVDSISSARYWMDEGMRMIGYSTDIKMITEIASKSVAELRAPRS